MVDEIALASKLHPDLSCNEEISKEGGAGVHAMAKPSTLSGGEMQRMGLIRTLGLVHPSIT